MIHVEVRDGFYIVTMPKSILVLTRAEFIQALRRGRWWRRRTAMHTRLSGVRPCQSKGEEGQRPGGGQPPDLAR